MLGGCKMEQSCSLLLRRCQTIVWVKHKWVSSTKTTPCLSFIFYVGQLTHHRSHIQFGYRVKVIALISRKKCPYHWIWRPTIRTDTLLYLLNSKSCTTVLISVLSVPFVMYTNIFFKESSTLILSIAIFLYVFVLE